MPRKPTSRIKRTTKQSNKRSLPGRIRSRNWTITINNPTDEICDEIALIIDEPFGANGDNYISYIAAAHEIGKKKNTPHLQGFLQCHDKGIIHTSRQIFEYCFFSVFSKTPTKRVPKKNRPTNICQ